MGWDERADHAPAPLTEQGRKDADVFDALGSRPRVRILELLAVRPMSVPELEKELRFPRVTLRYHLSVLLGQGLVEEATREGPRRVGRPARLYRATRRAVVTGYPRRRFDLIGELALATLVREVGESRACEGLRKRGQEIGEAMVRDVGTRALVTRWTPEEFERVVLAGHFRAEGAPTEVVARSRDEITYRSSHCPFLELAEKMPHLVCDALDVGYHEGVDRGLGGVRTERLACMAHGAPYCEYRMLWPARARKGRPRRVSRAITPATG